MAVVDWRFAEGLGAPGPGSRCLSFHSRPQRLAATRCPHVRRRPRAAAGVCIRKTPASDDAIAQLQALSPPPPTSPGGAPAENSGDFDALPDPGNDSGSDTGPAEGEDGEGLPEPATPGVWPAEGAAWEDMDADSSATPCHLVTPLDLVKGTFLVSKSVVCSVAPPFDGVRAECLHALPSRSIAPQISWHTPSLCVTLVRIWRWGLHCYPLKIAPGPQGCPSEPQFFFC